MHEYSLLPSVNKARGLTSEKVKVFFVVNISLSLDSFIHLFISFCL